MKRMIASTISPGATTAAGKADLTLGVEDPASRGDEHEHERAEQLGEQPAPLEPRIVELRPCEPNSSASRWRVRAVSTPGTGPSAEAAALCATRASGIATTYLESSALVPADADVLVIFGITGDLAKVMTFRSLYRLERRGLLDCPIVGVALDDWTRRAAREHARD